jgi:hypothetical protein
MQWIFPIDEPCLHHRGLLIFSRKGRLMGPGIGMMEKMIKGRGYIAHGGE